ncbi:MAG: J domain-containing protein [Salibacteraceae bacterium]
MNSIYFKVLELPINSTKAQVKSAYRRLAKKYHPDVSEIPNSRDKFIEVLKAYETLMDRFDRPIKYKVYSPKQRKTAYRKRARRRTRKKGTPKERAAKYSKMDYQKFHNSASREFPFPILEKLIIGFAGLALIPLLALTILLFVFGIFYLLGLPFWQ